MQTTVLEPSRIQPDAAPVTTPELSIVIASVNGYDYIAQCLRSLELQRSRHLAEVIVLECSGDDTAERVIRDFPWATVRTFSEPTSIPKLRALGIRESRADIAVTTEDHCVFDEGWYEAILHAHRERPNTAIGGAVENGSQERLIDWAVYVCEYGRFMLQFPAGTTGDLAGPNVSYKREKLEEACGDLLDRGVWENVLNGRLMERGDDLYIDPAIVVHHAKKFYFWDFLAQRYYFGRSYAAVRVQQAPLKRRLFYAGISLLLPPVFLYRYGRYFFVKKRHVKQYFRSFPLLVTFAIAWSIGELFGYALGDGGASLRVK